VEAVGGKKGEDVRRGESVATRTGIFVGWIADGERRAVSVGSPIC